MKLDPKTTAAGVLTMVGGAAAFVAGWLTHGAPPAEAWAALAATLTAGLGLIKAADSKPA